MIDSKGNLSTESAVDKAHTRLHAVTCTLAAGEATCATAAEFFATLMATFTTESGGMTCGAAQEHFFFVTAAALSAIGLMIRMAKGRSRMQKVHHRKI